MSVRINPSILAADFANLESELARIATADAVHVDVMDNHFVPNLTFGPQMVERLQAVSPIPLDVHLMITDVDRWAPGYAELGRVLGDVPRRGDRGPGRARAPHPRRSAPAPGSRSSPAPASSPYLELLPEFDQVLVMTVEPGFGGQSFMVETLPKLRAAREVVDRERPRRLAAGRRRHHRDTIVTAAEAGADTFVAGSSVYGAATTRMPPSPGLRPAAAASG